MYKVKFGRSLRNRQGERYGRLTIPGGLTKLISGKRGRWSQIYKKSIKKYKI